MAVDGIPAALLWSKQRKHNRKSCNFFRIHSSSYIRAILVFISKIANKWTFKVELVAICFGLRNFTTSNILSPHHELKQPNQLLHSPSKDSHIIFRALNKMQSGITGARHRFRCSITPLTNRQHPLPSIVHSNPSPQTPLAGPSS